MLVCFSVLWAELSFVQELTGVGFTALVTRAGAGVSGREVVAPARGLGPAGGPLGAAQPPLHAASSHRNHRKGRDGNAGTPNTRAADHEEVLPLRLCPRTGRTGRGAVSRHSQAHSWHCGREHTEGNAAKHFSGKLRQQALT